MTVVETVSEGTGNEVSPGATSYPKIGQGQGQVKRSLGGQAGGGIAMKEQHPEGVGKVTTSYLKLNLLVL